MTTGNDKPLARLSARKRRLIAQTVRDRIATNESFQQRFFEGCHPTSVTRATAELCALGWLASFPLIYPTKYFRLGKRAASAFGLTVHSTYPLGPQSLPTEYAVLRYTATNHHNVRRLKTREILTLHPWQKNEWLGAPHCIRRSSKRSITELIRVDLGGPADHIARKCQAEINARFTTDEFRMLLANREFQLVIITCATEKAAQIDTALTAHDWPDGLLFHIAVFTDLLPLLPRSF
jgi:hypothetical protein